MRLCGSNGEAPSSFRYRACPGPAVRAPPFPAGSGRRRGGVGAALTPVSRRFRRQWPAAGDSPACRYSRGGGRPPWPVRRSRSSNHDGERCVAGSGPSRPGLGHPGSPGPVGGHGPTGNSQEGAQGGGRLDRAAQGAGVPPVRNTSASSGEPALSHLTTSSRPRREGSARHWPPGGDHDTCRGGCVVHPPCSGVGFVFQSAPSCRFRTTRRPPSVDSELRPARAYNSIDASSQSLLGYLGRSNGRSCRRVHVLLGRR